MNDSTIYVFHAFLSGSFQLYERAHIQSFWTNYKTN